MGIVDFIVRCAQLALLLEVSGYPKPGNVHRTSDFKDTRYEHFLASAVAIEPCLRRVAYRGLKASRSLISLDNLRLGYFIKYGVREVLKWQSGGNTCLGILTLIVPLACAAAMSSREGLTNLRSYVGKIVKSTTPRDSIDFYDAISIANPGGLGSSPRLDVRDLKSRDQIIREGIGLFEVFKISADYDLISREWVTSFEISFEIGSPYFSKLLNELGDVNIATVHTFLKILSMYPDTLIARKAGLDRAREVSVRAREVLSAGGLLTEDGRRMIWSFDRELRAEGNRLNPGSTADLVASSIMISLLTGKVRL